MNKITVEPTGQFLLVDPHNRQVIHGVTEADETPFVLERIGTGQLRVVKLAEPKKGKAKPKAEEQ